MTEGFEQLQRQLGDAERRLARDRLRPGDHLVNRVLPGLAAVVALCVVAVVVLVGVKSSTRHSGAGSRTPPSQSTQPPAAGGASRALPCREAIGTQRPPRDMRVVLGVVALPASPGQRRALQTSRAGAGSSRLFAKWGLWVRSGAEFELIVPAALRGQLSIGWGNAGEGHVGSIVTDPRCRATHHRWINFAGGYWTTKPRCASLIVAANGRRRHVRIGIGRACPGQLPPPQPTQR